MKLGTAKVLDRSVLLLATLGLAGNAYHVPSAGTWSAILGGRPYLLLVLLVIVGVFGAFMPFESWYRRSLLNRSVTIRRRILSSFGRVLEIGNQVDPPLDTGDLALHVWRRTRGIRHPFGGKLTRVATYRMATFPMNRSFSPAKGVGVVGMCWERDREIRFDAADAAEKIQSEEDYDRYVAEHGAEAVMHLTWRQFDHVKHRTALFAVPIRDGRNRFVGCVSVDASHGYKYLNRRELFEEMSNLGLAIGQDEFQCA
ncbi:hypothetical protein [Amycolatopsis samaneae]|uniref:GAF domain-containing protein n=1 Tax=Amycolatopsis samaneae TaxID=664691 RepID=A0ABW5GAM0_9PSEU